MINDGDDGNGNDDGDEGNDDMMMTCNYYGGVNNDEGEDEWGDD